MAGRRERLRDGSSSAIWPETKRMTRRFPRRDVSVRSVCRVVPKFPTQQPVGRPGADSGSRGVCLLGDWNFASHPSLALIDDTVVVWKLPPVEYVSRSLSIKLGGLKNLLALLRPSRGRSAVGGSVPGGRKRAESKRQQGVSARLHDKSAAA